MRETRTYGSERVVWGDPYFYSIFKENQFANAGTLEIRNNLNTNNGLLSYASKLTKLVIEPQKVEKTALAGQIKYGPFDESVEKNSSVLGYFWAKFYSLRKCLYYYDV